ncbi:ROK family glucokinase [Aureibacillus halotolerans]|uniref:Glucokinase n=1 Tax=Aureibacillus halotolerans TaxID=1508390 RepID=A0A4R6U7M8_9BACI|nr:ROK family glucokinase [Aureibacillus halotolerans]TDQ41692.1 glucokinase [Aureibacillus halotolerans]
MESTVLAAADIGGTSIKLGLLSGTGDILDKWELPTDLANNGEAIPEQLAHSLLDRLKRNGLGKENVRGLGVGCPGFMDMDHGFVHQAVNIGWRDFPLKERLEKATGLSVIVDNDANVAALGEMWKGAGNDESDCLCITLGTGVGGGVIINNDIVHGTSGLAGEIGHVTVIRVGGARCNCGRQGCLETVCSATGIVRLAEEALETSPSITSSLRTLQGTLTAKAIFDAAKEDDALAKQVVDFVTAELGHVLAQFANVLNPKVIVIGGGVSKAGDALLRPVRQAFTNAALPLIAESCRIEEALLGNDAGIVGCAWLVNEKV